jgi:chemotaxis protein methyltransferase CheR
MMDVGISDLKKITQAIKDKYEYDFSNYAMSSFKRRIFRILELKNISPDELVNKISNNSFTKEEFLHEVTVNVTEMFRDPSFWKTIKTIVPAALQNREKIRIWHAGCSSGEEVYSMLILLKEMNLLDRAEIVASDIDKSILGKAKEGKISRKTMDINRNNYLSFSGDKGIDKYFKEDKDFFYFDKSMLNQVSFREIDLVRTVPFSKFDIILCRNVLIYFNQVLQNNVLSLFSNCLFSGGYMAIGAKESISWCEVANKFNPANQEEKIYTKIKD